MLTYQTFGTCTRVQRWHATSQGVNCHHLEEPEPNLRRHGVGFAQELWLFHFHFL